MNTRRRSSVEKPGKRAKSFQSTYAAHLPPATFPAHYTREQAEGATLHRNTHRFVRESGPSWPVCRSAPSRRQTSTSATVYGKETGLTTRNQRWFRNCRPHHPQRRSSCTHGPRPGTESPEKRMAAPPPRLLRRPPTLLTVGTLRR